MKITGLVAPIVLTGTIHVSTTTGVREVEVRFPPGTPITERDILRQVGKALNAVREGDPAAELYEAAEFFNEVLVTEKFGRPGNFDLPESFDYNASAVTAAALLAVVSANAPTVSTVQ